MPNQSEIEGFRPKRIAALETVVRDYVDAKADQKKAKKKTDAAGLKVAEALKEAGETAYGFKVGSRLFVVALQDREVVSLKIVDSKAKKGPEMAPEIIDG